jgi:hypothetical protein
VLAKTRIPSARIRMKGNRVNEENAPSWCNVWVPVSRINNSHAGPNSVIPVGMRVSCNAFGLN